MKQDLNSGLRNYESPLLVFQFLALIRQFTFRGSRLFVGSNNDLRGHVRAHLGIIIVAVLVASTSILLAYYFLSQPLRV